MKCAACNRRRRRRSPPTPTTAARRWLISATYPNTCNLPKSGSTLSMKALFDQSPRACARRARCATRWSATARDTRTLSAIASELATNRPLEEEIFKRHTLRGRNWPTAPVRNSTTSAAACAPSTTAGARRPAQRHHPLLVPAKVPAGRHHHHAQRALRHPRARRQPAVRAGAGARPVRQRLDAVHRAGGGRGGRQRGSSSGRSRSGQEIDRILGEFTDRVAPDADLYRHNIEVLANLDHDLCPRRPRPRDARRAAEDQRGGPRQPHARPPSAHRPGKGRALHPVDGRRVHHAGHHRPQHRRQDGDA